tara:strand:+ start:14361 stop:14894 length:534 start_codon:yes stop_codon:yes gene_type:complete
MRKLLFKILFLLPLLLLAQERWALDTEASYITYDADHFLHAWSGTNNNVKGVIVSEENEFKKIAIAMFVRDFDSKNSNRDNNALEILEVLKFPKIEFFSDNIVLTEDKILIEGALNFHGIGIEKTIDAKANLRKNKLIISGDFQMLLSDFKVTRPSFMMKKIEDDLKLTYELHFTRL